MNDIGGSPAVFRDVRIVHRVSTVARHGTVWVGRDAVRLLDDGGLPLAEAPPESSAASPVRALRGRTVAAELTLDGTVYYVSPADPRLPDADVLARELVRAVGPPALSALPERPPSGGGGDGASEEKKEAREANGGAEQPARRPPTLGETTVTVVLLVSGSLVLLAAAGLAALMPLGGSLGLLLQVLTVVLMASGMSRIGWPGWCWGLTALYGALLTLTAVWAVEDLTLQARGRWSDTAVVRVDVSRGKKDHPNHSCVLRRLDDGEVLRRRLSGPACTGSTRSGDLIRVFEDSRNLVHPQSGYPDATGEVVLGVWLVGSMAAVTAAAVVAGTSRGTAGGPGSGPGSGAGRAGAVGREASGSARTGFGR